jgi:hypothetical protein
VATANSDERRVLVNYFAWRSMTNYEAFHLGRMLADETLKGYISTTRAVTVARKFAKANGWVYLTRVRGGFLVPDKGTGTGVLKEWVKKFGEQEVALPGTLKWKDVFGFRQVDGVHRVAHSGASPNRARLRRTGAYETYEAPRNAANCVLRGLAMLARCNRLDSTARHQADAR